MRSTYVRPIDHGVDCGGERPGVRGQVVRFAANGVDGAPSATATAASAAPPPKSPSPATATERRGQHGQMSHGRHRCRIRGSAVPGAAVRRPVPDEELVVAAGPERCENRRHEIRVRNPIVRLGRAQANGTHVGLVCRGLVVVIAAQPIAGRRQWQRW